MIPEHACAKYSQARFADRWIPRESYEERHIYIIRTCTACGKPRETKRKVRLPVAIEHRGRAGDQPRRVSEAARNLGRAVHSLLESNATHVTRYETAISRAGLASSAALRAAKELMDAGLIVLTFESGLVLPTKIHTEDMEKLGDVTRAGELRLRAQKAKDLADARAALAEYVAKRPAETLLDHLLVDQAKQLDLGLARILNKEGTTLLTSHARAYPSTLLAAIRIASWRAKDGAPPEVAREEIELITSALGRPALPHDRRDGRPILRIAGSIFPVIEGDPHWIGSLAKQVVLVQTRGAFEALVPSAPETAALVELPAGPHGSTHALLEAILRPAEETFLWPEMEPAGFELVEGLAQSGFRSTNILFDEKTVEDATGQVSLVAYRREYLRSAPFGESHRRLAADLAARGVYLPQENLIAKVLAHLGWRSPGKSPMPSDSTEVWSAPVSAVDAPVRSDVAYVTSVLGPPRLFGHAILRPRRKWISVETLPSDATDFRLLLNLAQDRLCIGPFSPGEPLDSDAQEGPPVATIEFCHALILDEALLEELRRHPTRLEDVRRQPDLRKALELFENGNGQRDLAARVRDFAASLEITTNASRHRAGESEGRHETLDRSAARLTGLEAASIARVREAYNRLKHSDRSAADREKYEETLAHLPELARLARAAAARALRTLALA